MDQPFRMGRAWVLWGLLAYLVEIPFARNLEPWLRDLPLLVVSFGLVLGMRADRRAGIDAPRFELLGAALVFLATFAVSIAASENAAASFFRSAYLPIGVLAFLAAQYAFTDTLSFRRLSQALVVVALLIGIDGVAQMATGQSLLGQWPTYANTDRIRAGLPHPNDLSILAVILPLAAAPLHGSVSRWTLAALGIALPFLVLTAIASQSRNTWLGLVCALLVLLALGRMRKPLLITALGGLFLAFGLWGLDVGEFQSRIASLGTLAQEGRIGVWLSSLEMFREHPWFGIGPNLFSDFYLDALAQTDLPDGYLPEKTYMPWTHSLYLEALAERGAIGLAGFAILVAAALRRVALSLGRNRTGVERDYAVALAAAWAAFLVMGVFDLTFFKDWVWLFFWILVALSARLSTLRVGDAGCCETRAPGSTPTPQPTT